MTSGSEPLESIGAGRPSAGEMLERVRRQAGAGARGRLRIYIGMAPGVGKTFAMLNEGRRRKERGTGVVIGFVETYGRPNTIAAIGDLEIIPRKRIEYKGVILEELDTDALIARNPPVALVDELAHSNAPGSKHEKRWQDVQELLNHGITVISTVNIQHLESMADIVETITGVAVRERIPDAIVDDADEVEVVDMSPHALRQRMRHGNVYPKERAEQALHSFFREGNLNALRELVLRKVATTVEQDLEKYMREHQIDASWAAGDRVLVCLGDRVEAEHLLRRASKLAAGLQTELIALFVETPEQARSGEAARAELVEKLRYAEDLGAEIVRAQSRDIAAEILRVAKERNAGTIVVGQPPSRRALRFLGRSLVDRLLGEAREFDIYVVSA